jgi:hypothetical protein
MPKAKASIKVNNTIIHSGFSMPKDEHALIAQIQSNMTQRGIVASKSIVLRAALHALMGLPPNERLKLLEDLSSIKTGRPPNDKP